MKRKLLVLITMAVILMMAGCQSDESASQNTPGQTSVLTASPPSTPAPTSTPTQSQTPTLEGTQTPAPTSEPTRTSLPTATKAPTKAPTPVPTPTPVPKAYVEGKTLYFTEVPVDISPGIISNNVTITNIIVRNDKGLYEMVITIRNDTGYDIKKISIDFKTYDANGNLREDRGINSKEPLAAGATRGLRTFIGNSIKSVRFSLINYYSA